MAWLLNTLQPKHKLYYYGKNVSASHVYDVTKLFSRMVVYMHIYIYIYNVRFQNSASKKCCYNYVN